MLKLLKQKFKLNYIVNRDENDVKGTYFQISKMLVQIERVADDELFRYGKASVVRLISVAQAGSLQQQTVLK
jgi:hypothetical protein